MKPEEINQYLPQNPCSTPLEFSHLNAVKPTLEKGFKHVYTIKISIQWLLLSQLMEYGKL